MGRARPQLLQEPRPKKWLPPFSTNAVYFPWLSLDQDHLNSHKIPDILCMQLPDGFTLQGWDNSNSRAEFWDLCIWHKFQEVNTLPALSKS